MTARPARNVPEEEGRTMAALVAAKHNIAVLFLFRPDRRPHIVRARWELIARLRDTLGCGWHPIGRFINMRHSGVTYGYHRHHELSAATESANHDNADHSHSNQGQDHSSSAAGG